MVWKSIKEMNTYCRVPFLPGITLSALCALISYNSVNNHVVSIIIVCHFTAREAEEIK